MNAVTPNLYILELKKVFPAGQAVSKSVLRNFYRLLEPTLDAQAFRRILYALEKQHTLTPLGAGLYVIQEIEALHPARKQFVASPSQFQTALERTLQENYPFLKFLVWETRLLHEWMTHQPGGNQIILETEKEACEPVFNHLRQLYPGQVFLEPDRAMLERYVLSLPESILISRLITQAPQKKSGGMAVPRLEKILVDLMAAPEKFFVFQGEELTQIFENAFGAYWINEKTLFRYAGRRKVEKKLREFIQLHTNIELNLAQENNL